MKNDVGKEYKQIILARNWDRLGGRIAEIINALYVADLMNLDFRFTWPKEPRFPEMELFLDYLNLDFVEKYLIEGSNFDLADAQLLTVDGQRTVNQLRTSILESESKIFTVDNFFEVPKFRDIKNSAALIKYQDLAESIWSSRALEIKKSSFEKHRGDHVLHARYGDLVTGDWRNFVDPKKYVTGLQIAQIRQIAASLGSKLTIISDSLEVAHVLGGQELVETNVHKDREATALDAERTLQDLFRLQAAQKIYAPEASAFSLLGSHIGAKEPVKLIRERISSKSGMDAALESTNFWDKLPPTISRKLASRDLDMHINSLTGIIDLESFGDLTSAASNFDPTNPTSLNHHAIYLALKRDFAGSLKLLSKSKKESEASIEIHEDPLFMYYLTCYLIFMILLAKLGPLSATKFSKIVKILNSMEFAKKNLENLKPFQIDKPTVLSSIEKYQNQLLAYRKMRSRFLIIPVFRIFRNHGKSLRILNFGDSLNDLFILNFVKVATDEFGKSKSRNS